MTACNQYKNNGTTANNNMTNTEKVLIRVKDLCECGTNGY